MSGDMDDLPAGELATAVRHSPDGSCTLTVRGEIDLATVIGLRQALAEVPRSQDTCLVIDLCGVSYLDSAGIEVLYEQARQRWIELVVRQGSPIIRVLEVSGLTQAVPVRPAGPE
jgi:anti-sigma B factor antagonist